MAWQTPLVAVLLAGGVPLVFPLARKLLAFEFGSDHLAGISIITSVILGEYLVGSIVILMLSGGTALEQFASRRASSVLDALAKRMPQVAHRQTQSGLCDVSLGNIAVGDTLVVFPHEICPIDGVVVEGHGKMNEAYLTGEPFEIAKTPGSEVISGAVNGDDALHIRAEKLAVDSRYARIMKVMEDAEQRRPRIRRLGDKLGSWYTPVALLLAGISWAATGESHRFLAVLVVATPCPLLISIPVAVIGAISLSARRGPASPTVNNGRIRSSACRSHFYGFRKKRAKCNSSVAVPECGLKVSQMKTAAPYLKAGKSEMFNRRHT